MHSTKVVTGRRRHHVKMRWGLGWCICKQGVPRIRACPGSKERGAGQILPQSPRAEPALPILWSQMFRCLAPRTVAKQINFRCFKPPSWWYLHSSPRRHTFPSHSSVLRSFVHCFSSPTFFSHPLFYLLNQTAFPTSCALSAQTILLLFFVCQVLTLK